jgi:hypothetical protein
MPCDRPLDGVALSILLLDWTILQCHWLTSRGCLLDKIVLLLIAICSRVKEKERNKIKK